MEQRLASVTSSVECIRKIFGIHYRWRSGDARFVRSNENSYTEASWSRTGIAGKQAWKWM